MPSSPPNAFHVFARGGVADALPRDGAAGLAERRAARLPHQHGDAGVGHDLRAHAERGLAGPGPFVVDDRRPASRRQPRVEPEVAGWPAARSVVAPAGSVVPSVVTARDLRRRPRRPQRRRCRRRCRSGCGRRPRRRSVRPRRQRRDRGSSRGRCLRLGRWRRDVVGTKRHENLVGRIGHRDDAAGLAAHRCLEQVPGQAAVAEALVAHLAGEEVERPLPRRVIEACTTTSCRGSRRSPAARRWSSRGRRSSSESANGDQGCSR